ncbi:MAG: carboxypeptidase-like regulatory domain-containing protein [Candidatus Thermoplasmatota archaeon]
MRSLAILALLAGALLAGCSSSGNDSSSDTGPTFDDLGLDATATTGVIRGIVVDDAIRPVAGASIALKDQSGRQATTTDAGTFGFEGLAPGTYFLTVTKPGYFEAQQSAEVVAGVAEPAIVKVQLAVDAANLPYVEAYVFSGFIECMTPNLAACGLVNGLVEIGGGPSNLTADNSQVVYPLAKVPSWIQTEMVWTSTQALGGEMSVMYSWLADCDNGGFYCDHSATGPSPLLLTATPDDIAMMSYGEEEPGVYIRTFTASVPEDPVGSAGLTLEQSFEYYTHIFYGYQPTEGWRFSSGEPVPQPPQ